MEVYDPDALQYSDYDCRQLARFPASHHGAPLTYFPQRHIIRILSGNQDIRPTVALADLSNAAIDLNTRLGGGYQITDNPTIVYSHFLNQSLTLGSHDQLYRPAKRSIEDCLGVAYREMMTDLKALKHAHPGLGDLIHHVTLPDRDMSGIALDLSKAMTSRLFLEKLRNTVQQNHISRNEGLTEVGTEDGLTAFTKREMYYFVVTQPSRLIVLLNYDQILMLFDTISCRMMTRVTLMVSQVMRKDNLPPWSLIKNIYKWGDNLITQYGVKAYTVIGEFESIVTGIFVTFRDTDILNLGAGFIQSITDTAAEIEEDYQIPRTHIMELIQLLRSVGSVNWLSEIFGLRKHWGNPMVDADASGEAVQEKVAEILPVQGTALVKLLASFNRMITMSFIEQHGKWPDGVFTEEGQNTPIGEAKARGITRVPETHVDHDHLHWAMFKFLPNCVIDTYINDLALVSDKAVSVYRSHLDTTYVKKLCHVDLPAHVDEDRRLVLEYVRTNHLSILDIFRVVMSGVIPNEWLANCASMKGTEMKYKKARIFAVLTYEVRQYFAATEELIKDHLFRYNPHQTMTMGESELLAKLRNITRQLDPTGESRFLAVMHIVDFSKWNLRMRYTNTCPVFKSIDDFLGTPGLIESSHIIFSNMVNIVQDAFNPPRNGVLNTENKTIWRNHTSGWEGQRQKGWTIETSAVLSDLARVTGVKSTICGQGDNQTLLAQFPVPDIYRNPHEWITRDPEGVKRALDTYYEQLESECLAVGLKIKTAETCRSLDFFNYGKRLYMNGGELSMTLKRISKNITEPNESYPTSESLLKTLEGSAYAAGLYCHPSLLPYLIGRFSVALQLEACFLRNQLLGNVKQTLLRPRGIIDFRVFLAILMKIPATLGGPPQLGLAAYLYRGHPDPLCTDLVQLVLKARYGCPRSRKILSCARAGIWFSEDNTTRESLIAAPYSLNLNIPLSSRVPLEREIKPALRERCRNKLIRGMFEYNMDVQEEQILRTLSQMTPFHPLIANDIYSRSLPGRRQAFLSGLANTTSLGRLIYDSRTNPLINRIRALEQDQLESWISRALDVFRADESTWVDISHHALAEEFRTKSWRTSLVGVTVPHPLEQFMLIKTQHDLCGETCSRCLSEHLVLARHSENLQALPGQDSLHITSQRSKSGSPYLGSTITEGIIQKQVQCVNPDETWRDVIRLNTIRKWVTTPGSELDTFLIKIIRSRTNVDLATIDRATGEPSRISFNHRAKLSAVITTCGVSTTANMHSRLYISSNRMGRYSHGECNYHMPFGPVFLCYQELACISGVYMPEEWRRTARTNYHIHVRADDVPVVFDGDVTLVRQGNFNLPNRNAPPIMFADRANLEFEIPSGVAPHDIWSSIDRASATESRYGYSYQLIADSFVKETVVRESVTHDRISGYEPRPISVTIGDVGLVGVKSLIRALAWNFLLLSPLSVWAARGIAGFKVRAYGFINNFSTRFWETFTPALSAERTRQQLTRIYRDMRDPYMTRQTAGLRSIMVDAVLTEMWNIYSRLIELLRIPGACTPIALYAPSLPSLKLLLSKYVELMVYLAVHSNPGRRHDAFMYSRDFSFNLQSSESTSIHYTMTIIRSDFNELLTYLELPRMFLPQIKLYPLQYPWVDKLQRLARPAPIELYQEEITPPEAFPDLASVVVLNVPDQSVTAEFRTCNCVVRERVKRFHTECYFMPSGIMSKSHFKFMDIVWALHLNIAEMMCLGTSTGSEAYAFAKQTTCSKVYANCLHRLTEFSQHLAGSYVPAAFSSGELNHKLICPSSAAMASSDLLEVETIHTILNHTAAHLISGVTCDAEFPAQDSDSSIATLLNNLMLLVSLSGSVEWLVCKVSFKCVHEIKRFCSILSQCFTQIRVVSSVYTRPGAPLIYLVGTNRRPSRIVEWGLFHVPVPIYQEERINELIDNAYRLEISPLFAAGRGDWERRAALQLLNENSFYSACNHYVPGWGGEMYYGVSREAMKDSLDEIIHSLQDQARDYLRISNSTHAARNQPRSSILQLSPGALNLKLNTVYTYINRCELLLSLLTSPNLSIYRVIDRLRAWISSPHDYPMQSRDFRLEINASHFINNTSRYLFEILGYVYGYNFSVTAGTMRELLYHHISPLTRSRIIMDLYEPVPETMNRQTVDIRWRWPRRSEILTWLFVHKMAGRPISVDSESRYMLLDFHSQGLLTDIYDISEMHGQLSLVTVSVAADLDRLITFADPEIFIIVPTNLCPLIHNYMTVIGMYKCPWSGILPSSVLIHGTTVNQHLQRRCGYPRFNHLVNASYQNMYPFVDCKCWDCSVEHDLCSIYGLTHAQLDQLCSLRVIESVRDIRHLL